MRRVPIALVLLILAAPLSAGEFITAADPAEVVPNSYIVVFTPGAASEAISTHGVAQGIATLARETAASHGASVERVFEAALQGAEMTIFNPRRARALAKNPNVQYVEENTYVHLSATQNNATWGLDRIDQRDLPLDDTYTYETTASNVNAYVIDTGIRVTHDDFGGRASHGYDAVDGDSDASDCNGHGTHVAGTVGGTTWGVAKQVSLVAVRVLNCQGSGTTSGVIAGIDWVTQNHVAPAVANMSLGGGASTSLDDAVENSIAAGVTYVVAAGNDNADACNSSPARVPAAITVGSSTSSDSRSSFSNYGTCLDVFAPGSSITSAWYTSDTATNTISGTSMASPHVAGVAALYLANNTSASPATVSQAITDTATSGRLSSVGSGSPNLLVYSLLTGDGGGGGGDTELANSVPVTASGADGSQEYYYIDVPSGASNLEISTSGGSGDVDLYVRYGSKPTLSSYDCRPYRWGNDETCSFASPAAGTWWIMLHGYDAYSGVSLVASYDTATPNDPPTASFTFSTSDLTASFTDTSSDSDGSIASWSWDFGDGATSTSQNPTHTYAAAGTYTVTLTVTDDDGATDSASQSVTVTEPSGSCSGDLYTGTLSGSGDSEYEPNGTYYYSGSGTHSGVLDGPSGTDFDLYLYKWNGWSWSRVASSTSSDSHEEIVYSGTSGYYTWRVYSYSGSGSYELCLDVP